MAPPSQPPEPRFGLPRGLAPLGFPNFALFCVGFVTTNIGRWIELTGSLWLVFELTDLPGLLGLVGIFRAVPALILGPVAGVVADRVDPRKLIIVTQTLGFVASAALGVLVVTGRVEVWHVYLQVAAQAAILAFDAPARQTYFPSLIPRLYLSEAVTLNVSAARLAEFVGPVIGGVAIANLGVASPYFLNAVTYLVFIVTLVAIRGVSYVARSVGSTFRAELAEGLRYIVGVPVVAGLLRLEIVFGIFQMNSVMVTIFARSVFGVGAEGLGLLLSAQALGAIIGVTGLVTFGQPRRQGRFGLICMFAYSLALVAFAFAPEYAQAFAMLSVIGLLDSLMTVNRLSILQLAVPPRMRGRTMGNMGTITRGVSPLAETQSGVLASLIGPQLAVVAAAGSLAAAAGITVLRNRPLWTFTQSVDLAHLDPATTPPLPPA